MFDYCSSSFMYFSSNLQDVHSEESSIKSAVVRTLWWGSGCYFVIEMDGESNTVSWVDWFILFTSNLSWVCISEIINPE